MSDRAVSEVISYVLVFALITGAVAVVSVSGLATLQDTRDAEQINNAERAYDVLGDNIADIYRRDAPSRATELNLAGSTLSTGENVTIEIAVDEGSGFTTESTQQVRPLVFSGEEDRQLVYEAGAVFRTNRNGGLRVQDPPFILENDRVLISVVGLNRPGVQSVSGSTALVRADNENSTVEYENTIGGVDQYRISISNTQHAGLWEKYFTETGLGSPSCSTTSSSVECTFSPTGSDGRFYVVYHDIFLSIDR